MGSFRRAERSQAKARIAICGPAGSGKTKSALRIAKGLAGEGGRIALIDTEHGSASKYADQFDFDVVELESYNPRVYIEKIDEAAKEGYPVLIIDSLTHAWSGKDGALELIEKARAKYKGQNSWAAWREVTPVHNELVEAILAYPGHVIVTMRSKMEYIQVEENGKVRIEKVGMQPIQREGMEYEFDLVGDMDINHNFVVTKTRIDKYADQVVNRPGEDLGADLRAWLSSGKPVEPKITEEQRKQIRDLAAKAGVADRDVPALLMTDFGVDHTKKLTKAQADTFIAHLEAMIADKKEGAA